MTPSEQAKLRGGYYTPAPIADFVAEWAIDSADAVVLEPSAGDGSFVRAAASRLVGGRVDAVELFQSEAARIVEADLDGVSVTNSDAFGWYDPDVRDGTYDAVVGNPPFIRYQTFPEEHRTPGFALMHSEGLSPNRLTNAWVPFVVLATRALRPGGRIGMVLPAELLQVSYAAELREYLARQYSDLTVVTFRRLVFDGIQQETVLLLGKKTTCREGSARMSFVQLDDAGDLGKAVTNRKARVPVDLDHAREKWTQFYLSPRELGLVRELEESSSLTTLGALADVDVGIVTGRNEFFVLTPSQAAEWELERFCLPLVGRSAQIPGLVLREEAWQALADDDGRCLLLQLGKTPRDELTPQALAYVSEGEHAGFHTGYKCRIRMPAWWFVPSTAVPDAFLLRQIHDGPRIVANAAGAVCTDTIHRVRVADGVSVEWLAAASMNSLTYAFAEIRGRSYGGGVLELEPTEAESLPFPIPSSELPLDDLDLWARRKSLPSTLDEVDRLVLGDLGLSKADRSVLRGIWSNLSERRLARKRR